MDNIIERAWSQYRKSVGAGAEPAYFVVSDDVLRGLYAECYPAATAVHVDHTSRELRLFGIGVAVLRPAPEGTLELTERPR